MSSSDALNAPTWGQTLPPPPPPPPMPPPSASPVSPVRSVSPDQPNSFSQQTGKNLSLPTTSYEPSPTSIRPTTAGLLRFPALPDSIEQQQQQQQQQLLLPVHSRSLSPQFKQELLEKQSKLSRSPGAHEDAATSIEDKIRQNKMHHQRSNTIHYDQRPFQNQQVPDKLLSAMQKETKPFAYTVNVSDPNNRGKLDLSQIKSPIMRRRLLANMESSTEERELEDDDDDHDYEDELILRRSETISPTATQSTCFNSTMTPRTTNHLEPNQRNFDSNICSKNQNKSISFSPIVTFSYGGRDNLNAAACNQRACQQESQPIIRYNEPPKFYNTHQYGSNNSTSPAHAGRFNHQPGSESSFRSERSTMDRLDAEMAETLDDFERMLSDMSMTSQPQSSRQVVPFQSTPQLHCYPQQPTRLPTAYNTRYCYDQQLQQTGSRPANLTKNCQGNNCCSSCPGGVSRDERTSRSCLRTFQA